MRSDVPRRCLWKLSRFIARWDVPRFLKQFRLSGRQPSEESWQLEFASEIELAAGGKIVALEITQRETNGICILALTGRLVLGKESGGFRTTVENLVSSGVTRIVVNLEHANYIDS